jgi:hypothetical protein
MQNGDFVSLLSFDMKGSRQNNEYFSITKTIHPKTKEESILETSYRAVQFTPQD